LLLNRFYADDMMDESMFLFSFCENNKNVWMQTHCLTVKVSWSGVRIHVDAEPVIFGATRNAPNAHSAHARSSGARSPVIVARRQEIGAYYSRRSFLF
jgi:hypothetical protein